MRVTQDIEIYEDMKPGWFRIPNTPGEEKVIYLAESKLSNLKYEGKNYKMWLHHEDELISYPQSIQQNSTIFYNILRKIIADYKDLTTPDDKFKNWKGIALVILALGGLFYLISQSGGISAIMGSTAQATKEIVTTITPTPGLIGR